MITTQLCLVRHGETDWNVEKRLQGHTDVPLNSRGRLQALQMAQALKLSKLSFDALYTSDLKRAVDTANAIVDVFAYNPITVEGLRERHFGALQGLSIWDAPILKPSIWSAHLSRELNHELDGGESIAQFANRVKNFLDHIERQHSGKRILVVSHGGTLEMMYRLASKQDLGSERSASVPNASLNWLSHDGIHWSVERWADTRHLDGRALENTDL